MSAVGFPTVGMARTIRHGGQVVEAYKKEASKTQKGLTQELRD